MNLGDAILGVTLRKKMCRNGHERTKQNTTRRPNGALVCIPCRTAQREREYRIAKEKRSSK